MRGGWVVVVPVKQAERGKTRLSGVLDDRTRAVLVRAMALDTLEAVLGTAAVARVVLVTGDEELARDAVRQGRGRLRVLPEPVRTPATTSGGPAAPTGLDRAVAAGVAAGRAEVPGASVAVLLGDVPGLAPQDLGDALAAAAGHDRAVVVDAEGTGTTLLTLAAGVPFASRFGTGSAAAHRALGHVALEVPASSTVRHDVDLPADLVRLPDGPGGRRTTALLARLRDPGAVGRRALSADERRQPTSAVSRRAPARRPRWRPSSGRPA